MTNKWTSRGLSKRFQTAEPTDAELEKTGVILLQGKNVFGDQVYSYLQLSLRKALELKAHMEEGKDLNPSDFGTVIAAGNGYPSDELKAEMAKAYHMIDAPTVKRAPAPRIPATTSFWGEDENESNESSS